jgi:hypothetical protein
MVGLKEKIMQGMAVWIVLLVYGFSGESFALSVADAAPPAETVTVHLPVLARDPSGNTLGLGLSVSVAGGQEKALLLDTGSTGVRIFSSAVGATDLVRTGKPEVVRFADGTVFEGEIARAPVAISPGVTTGPIDIHLVEKVYCEFTHPNCAVSKLGQAYYTQLGYFGIVGVRLKFEHQKSVLSSLFAQLPGNLSSGFIIKLGKPGSTQGDLILGLNTENTSSFRFAQLPLDPVQDSDPEATKSWIDTGLEACYTFSAPPIKDLCYPTIFDTGATAAFITYNRFPGPAVSFSQLLPAGETMRMTLPGYFDYSINVGSDPNASHVDKVVIRTGTSQDFNSGIGFFFSYDVAFDIKTGRIGFRDK